MEPLREALSVVLGEPLARLEKSRVQPYATLYALYDQRDRPLPYTVKVFHSPGIAMQEQQRIAWLAQAGIAPLPQVYGLVTCERATGISQEMLLMARVRGVPAEAPSRTPQRWQALCQQITEALLAWHRVHSRAQTGTLDLLQQTAWRDWYLQRIDVIWALFCMKKGAGLSDAQRRFLRRVYQHSARLLAEGDEQCVLVHGNVTLRTIWRHVRTDQLLAMTDPGLIQWAPREYDLFRLYGDPLSEQLLACYLRAAPPDGAFLWRRWLYAVWESVYAGLLTGKLAPARFQQACESLKPWLES